MQSFIGLCEEKEGIKPYFDPHSPLLPFLWGLCTRSYFTNKPIFPFRFGLGIKGKGMLDLAGEGKVDEEVVSQGPCLFP